METPKSGFDLVYVGRELPNNSEHFQYYNKSNSWKQLDTEQRQSIKQQAASVRSLSQNL